MDVAPDHEHADRPAAGELQSGRRALGAGARGPGVVYQQHALAVEPVWTAEALGVKSSPRTGVACGLQEGGIEATGERVDGTHDAAERVAGATQLATRRYDADPVKAAGPGGHGQASLVPVQKSPQQSRQGHPQPAGYDQRPALVIA